MKKILLLLCAISLPLMGAEIEADSKKIEVDASPFVIGFPLSLGYGVNLRALHRAGIGLEFAPMYSPKQGGYMFSHENMFGFTTSCFYFFRIGRFQPYGGISFTLWREYKDLTTWHYAYGKCTVIKAKHNYEETHWLTPLIGLQYNFHSYSPHRSHIFIDAVGICPRIGFGMHF